MAGRLGGSSAEPDEPEADEVPEPDVCEPAQDEPPLARETKEELPEPAADQLAHISGRVGVLCSGSGDKEETSGNIYVGKNL